MSSLGAPAAASAKLPILENYAQPELPRARLIEQAQAYLADLHLWLRENNHLIAGRRAIEQFTAAHDRLYIMAFDHVMHEWNRAHEEPPPQWALVAMGGFGRRELFLKSDIDTLVLMESHVEPLETLVKSLVHLLIDFKLNLSYTTRTAADCISRIGADLDSTTALIESRHLAGSRALYQKMTDGVGQALSGKGRRWFVKALYQEWQDRHARFQSTIYVMEPNVKECHGGLRDVHSIKWMLHALNGSSELTGLKELARFDEKEVRQLREAWGVLERVRNEIHIASDGKNDQLLFALQPVVAQRLNYEAEGHRLAEELFMADYYRHARTIARLSGRAMNTLLGQEKTVFEDLRGSLRRRRIDQYLLSQNNVVFLDPHHPDYFDEDPGRIMALFERAVRNNWKLSERTLDRVARTSESLGPAFRLDPENQRRFLQILKGARNIASTLVAMHDCGILTKLLPEFERIRHMVRIDYYHHYTVDEHTLKALREAELLRHEPPGKRTFAAEVAADIKRWDLLYLALLLHDIGKGYGRGHALRGGQIAQRIGDRLKLPPADVDTVRWIVLSHLKLTHASQRRDLSDPSVAQQLADEIGTMERLKLLYVHSVCDLKAVSPETYNDWKAQLMAECYVRTAEILNAGRSDHTLPAPNLQVVREHVLDVLQADAQREGRAAEGKQLAQELDSFLTHVSDRYLQSKPAEAVAQHFTMLRALNERNQVEWRLTHDNGRGFSELTVCAIDVPGLFSFICGALAAKGINIWSAQIFSTTDGYAINQFQVTDLENKTLPVGLRLDRLRQDLNLVIRGEKSMRELFERQGVRRRRRAQPRSPLKTTVSIDNSSSQEYTLIEVRTPDRVGLLYRITHALHNCQLNIHRAIINTEAYGVVDIFYVTDLEYNKIFDKAQQQKIERALLDAIDPAQGGEDF